MRKCGSCGYLLLGNGDSCAQCGAPLPVVHAGIAAAAARAATPVTTVASPSQYPPAPNQPPLAASAPAAALPSFREDWQPVAVSEPVAHPPRWTRLGLIALAVAIAMLGGAGVMHFRSDPLPAGTSDFASGGGITYTSPDGTFQVQLPKEPELGQQRLNVNGMTSMLYTATANTNDYEIGGGSMVLPDSVARTEVQA